MKKVIRLTESDLIRIVKKTISELDKSTYEKASKIADKKGYTKHHERISNGTRLFGKYYQALWD